MSSQHSNPGSQKQNKQLARPNKIRTLYLQQRLICLHVLSKIHHTMQWPWNQTWCSHPRTSMVYVKPNGTKSTILQTYSWILHSLAVLSSIMHMPMLSTLSILAQPRMSLTEMETQQHLYNTAMSENQALLTSASLDSQSTSNVMNRHPATSWSPTTTTLEHIPWYLQWIPRKLSQHAILLSWTSPAHCNHPQRLFWQRVQLSPCLWLKTICQSNPHLIPLRPKWTPNFWQFWTLNCAPNWIWRKPWPLTIHFHWRTWRPNPSKNNIIQHHLLQITKMMTMTLILSQKVILTLDQHLLRWSTLPSTKRDTLHYKRKGPYTSKCVLSPHCL